MANIIQVFKKSFMLRSNCLYSASRFLSVKPEVNVEASKKEAQEHTVDENVLRTPMYYPSDFDKRMLVFAGRYKKKEDVPKSITYASFDSARNKARIKLSNYMMLATVIACICVAMSGKRAAERGESLHQMNLDWHKEVNKKS